ncbi:MAG: M23 family metallopeptidase [Fibrobacteres bacterium]|nr:M23 family metallopeptidase [Fibrobacterota bacterium]
MNMTLELTPTDPKIGSELYRLPELDPVTNLGPKTFYPADPKQRLYYMPFDYGLTYKVTDPPFNRPDSDHKGYAIDWNMPVGATVIASRPGIVSYIAGWSDDNNGVKISRDEWDSDVLFTTSDFYIHLVLDPSIVLGRRIERGEIIGVVGIENHLHLEVQVSKHSGVGKDGRFTNDVPFPIVEITDRTDGIPWNGDICKSQNICIQ